MEYKVIKYSPIVEAVWAAILLVLCVVLIVSTHASGADVNLELVPAMAAAL